MARGKNAQEAFLAACDDARYEHGHGGYTGTIAEKHDFIVIAPSTGKTWSREAATAAQSKMIQNDDPRIADKWGPAGCLPLEDGSYLFFGIASD